ncbi:HpcH/HpaI aldolase/citrate lyase family protein [Ahrensia sp. R2A130]|uniref:HpcH/HpaI aldolase family protein n=1 Tax=Ahrensia sp. R2A130 TaxID=744979 RepID=UPI0001E094C3|nr:aldolase/citrate lyase family protein [Ahrensia sp. R2A130]EFL88170.1 5-keto-4-deoxy-D-glucarate aldolase [Ahrensia sp. R2A130]
MLDDAPVNPRTKDKLLNIRTRMAAGEPLQAAWLFMGCPIAAEVVAHGPFDFLILDTEHSPNTNESLYGQLRACDACEMPVVVRVPEVSPSLIKLALDAGAAGIAVPDMRHADEAAKLVQHMRYSPAGRRGTHRVARAAGYGFDWASYVNEVAPALLSIALIESAQGVEATPAIAATEGIDAVFIGAVDLAADLGHLNDMGHADVATALARIEEAVAASPAVLGGLAGSVAQAREKVARGYGITSVGSDLVWLRDKVMTVAKEMAAS